jgi:cell shape-determining protein MreD
MNLVAFFVYLWLVAMHVVILRDLTTIDVISINLPALLVLLTALYKEDVSSAWFGFFVGLIAAVGGPPEMLGWHALLMAVMAISGCHIRDRLNVDAMWAKLLFILGGITIHNLASLLMSGHAGSLGADFRFVLAGAVYTTGLAALFFLNKSGRLTFQRLKAIF